MSSIRKALDFMLQKQGPYPAITTLDTLYDITLQELRVECLFPAHKATEQNWQKV
jgi:hypothetical protein